MAFDDNQKQGNDLWGWTEQDQLRVEREQRYEQWLRDLRTNPVSGDGGGMLLVLFSVAVAALTMFGVGSAVASAGATRVAGPRFILAIPGILAGLAVFFGAGRLFFNLRSDTPPGPRRVARACVSVAGVLVLAAGASLATRLMHPGKPATPADSVPAGFAAQAASDFDQAMRLLAEGNISGSAERFTAAMEHRAAAGDRPHDGKTFEAWCAAREAEYRQAADAAFFSFARRVEAGELTPAEVDNFLRVAGSEETRAAWDNDRPDLERRLAKAIAAKSYRAKLAVHTVAPDAVARSAGAGEADGNDTDAADRSAKTAASVWGGVHNLDEDDQRPLTEAIAGRLGPAPLVPASEAKGAAPEEGLGTVSIDLEFVEETYTEEPTPRPGEFVVPGQRVQRRRDFKIPVALIATITVATRGAPGAWDGTHRYYAAAATPARLSEADAVATNNRQQRALVAQVAKKIAARSDGDSAEALYGVLKQLAPPAADREPESGE